MREKESLYVFVHLVLYLVLGQNFLFSSCINIFDIGAAPLLSQPYELTEGPTSA